MKKFKADPYGVLRYLKEDLPFDDEHLHLFVENDLSDLANQVLELQEALKRYRWRPISEIHEDYGYLI